MTVGQRVRPLNWEDLTLGKARFTADLPKAREALRVAIVRSPLQHASILSIDTSAAVKVPGVHGVITAADFAPGVRYHHRGGDFSDWPPLADGRVLYVGQEVAAVAAETMDQAQSAAAKIRIHYKRLRPVDSMKAALDPGAPALHARATGDVNVASNWIGIWGDVEAGRRASTFSIEGLFRYPSTVHACMEPNITLAEWDPDRSVLQLWTSTQAPYFIVKEVAHVLGLEPEQVVCREVAVGGGFGSKSKISSHEVVAAALAIKTGRATLVQLSRDEEFATNKTRHEFTTRLVSRLDDTGLIRAYDADIRANNGAFCHMGPSVLRVGAISLGSIYRPDGVEFDARLVDTNQLPGGPFRGYGTPQVSFAIESQVDEAANSLGEDPIDLRLKNLRAENEPTLCGYRVGSSALARCLDEARAASGWDQVREARPEGVGIGVAVGMHGSGSFAYPYANRSDAAIDLADDGRVLVRFGGADAGTGQRTVLAQIASGVLGIPLSMVTVLSMDSERTPFEMGAWSSRGTHMTGHAVTGAATRLRTRLEDAAREALGSSSVTFAEGAVFSADGRRATLGELIQGIPETVDGVLTEEYSYLDAGTEMMAPGQNTANLSPSYAFAAHVAKVHVNRRTGKITLLDYVAAHDLGTAINPTLAEGQIMGGAVMGIGGALGEELLRDGGAVVNGSYLNYAMPRASDVPPVRPIIVDSSEDLGPFGAKSVGEMSLIPAAGAVANAVADAVGIRLRDLPLTPDKVLVALAEQSSSGRSFGIWRRPSRWWIALVRWAYPRGLHRLLHRWGTRFGRRVTQNTPLSDVSFPSTASAAATARARGAVVVGGGTDLMLQLRQGLQPAAPLVSLSQIVGAREIREDGAEWRVGAAVTLTELAEFTRNRVPIIASAIETIASPQVRNVATVAGNLIQAKRCWFYRNGFPCYKRSGPTNPCYAILGDHRFQHAAIGAHRCQAVTPSDLAGVLLAVDAKVIVEGPTGERAISVSELYSGPGETNLTADEVVSGVVLPKEASQRRGAFAKLALYSGDFAITSVSVSFVPADDGRWTDTRVVVGAMAPTPIRLGRVETQCEARVVSADDLERLVSKELTRIGHPLPRNAWKLDATAGLAYEAASSLSDTDHPSS